MTDTTTTTKSCEWLDEQLAAARREATGARNVLECWLKRVEAAWGDLDANQRVVHSLPDDAPQKRAVLRVMRVAHRLASFRERERVRDLPPHEAEARRAQERSKFEDAMWRREFADLDSSLHHFAALRGVEAAVARGLVLDVAERFHREVACLHQSRLASIGYGIDGSAVEYDPKSQGERTVRHGGVRVSGIVRPAPGAQPKVEISFYRAAGNNPGDKGYAFRFPIDFDPETVELPKLKEPPQVYGVAAGSSNIVAFLVRYLHRVGADREAWLKANLGLVVSRYCEAEGIRGIPEPDSAPGYGGSEVGSWCPKKRKWLVSPGVSLADIDLLKRTLTVQVAQGNGRRMVNMPIERLVSDFPSTSPVGDQLVRVDGVPGRPFTYAVVGRHSDGEVDIALFDSIKRAREMFDIPLPSDAGLVEDDPWAGHLQNSLASRGERSSKTNPAKPPRSAADFARATAVLSSGLFG